jgi:carboxypeptidase T
MILFTLFLSVLSWSQSPLSSFDLSYTHDQEAQKISRFFEVVKDEDGKLEALVPSDQISFFQSLAPRAQLKEIDISIPLRQRIQEFEQQRFLFGYKYHSFDEVLLWMKNVEESSPNIAKIVSYGTSAGGKPLQALRIGTANAKSTLLLTAATHGDELITTEVLMDLANKFILGYGSDSRITRILDAVEIYFVPVVNPDGFVKVQRYDSGRDPNRSYPYPEKEKQVPTASIDGLIKLFHSKTFRGTLDFHAFGEMVMYPWAYTRSSIPDEDKVKLHRITQSMAETNDYAYGPISEVIYIAPGSSADYYYWRTRSMSIAVEIGKSKVPNPNNFPAIFESQSESTLRFIESFLASRE